MEDVTNPIGLVGRVGHDTCQVITGIGRQDTREKLERVVQGHIGGQKYFDLVEIKKRKQEINIFH